MCYFLHIAHTIIVEQNIASFNLGQNVADHNLAGHW